MFEPFSLPFVQRGLLEVLALSVAAGLLGTWIVLRGLAFFAHAVGTAAFPGLVLADGLGFAAPLGALGVALLFTAGVASATRTERAGHGTATALVLVACLAAGVILASDVFGSGANVETLLFGSLLLIGPGDVRLAAAVAVVVLAASLLLGRRWLAVGFDPAGARALGARSAVPDLVLLGLIALATVAALSAVGALLATALFVVPAATVRLLTDRLATWQVATVALAALEGTAGLWLAVQTDAPPGATIGVVAAALFALAGAARARRLAGALAAMLALGALAGCGSDGGAGGERLRVVATTTQLGDFAREVGGDAAQVTQILRPNTDPHDYEPRPSDVGATAKAAVVLESGDGLDHWMAHVVEQSGAHPRVVDVGATVPVRLPGEATGAEASRFDPHWWHDPANARAAVRTIARALSRAQPSSRATFAANARRYLARLARLDRGIAACIDRLPARERKLVTDHDAFGYFAHRYGLRVVGAVIPSQTTQAQASAADVSRLVEVIRRERVRAVFPESSLNPRLAEAIARQTGARADWTLYGDTLGPTGSPGATYVGMEQANADAIVRGLTGGGRGCRIEGLQ
jgi:ABC-type Zn uptake system ZnuABC Zn-binding protein ZnuA